VKSRITGTIQPGPRLWKMLRSQGENWIEEQESDWSVKSLAVGLVVLAGGIALLLYGFPIVAAVLGRELVGGRR
jgi:hypothetical protein